MYRYTTPTITMTFGSDVDLSDVSTMNVTLRQAGVSDVTKTLEDITIDGSTAEFTLTQDETSHFAPGIKIELQAHFKLSDGTVMASEIKPMSIKKTLDEEVL